MPPIQVTTVLNVVSCWVVGIEMESSFVIVDYSIQMSKIKVLTLNHGKMTNSRRVPAVPQLKCVGGTAGCRAFIPQVVFFTIFSCFVKL